MKKRAQNIVAESNLSLPFMAIYATVLCMVAGIFAQGWWVQFVCLALSAYFMVELSNSNALLRVRSRMVSCTFLALSGTVISLLSHLLGGIAQMCFIAAILLLFHTYQDGRSPGRPYYAFLLLGIATLCYAPLLWLVPVCWLLMLTQLQSLSWRTWLASIVGVLTPYWFLAAWLLFQQDFSPLLSHFSSLASWPMPYDYATIAPSQWVVFILIVLITYIGMVHFWNQKSEEKIRIRQLYGMLSTLCNVFLLWIALQPQHYDPLIRLAIVCASPLIAHFITLTSTRLTNATFWSLVVIILLITLLNLWPESYQLLPEQLQDTWMRLLNF